MCFTTEAQKNVPQNQSKHKQYPNSAFQCINHAANLWLEGKGLKEENPQALKQAFKVIWPLNTDCTRSARSLFAKL